MQRALVTSCIALLLLGVFPYQSLQAQSESEDIARCDDLVVQPVGKHFSLGDFSYPPRGGYPSAESGRLIAGVCKPWPQDRRRVIAAFAYDAGIQYQKDLLLALVDARTGEVIASHKRVIPEDAAGEVTSSSLMLDTARYVLSKSTRAFGVRIDSFRDHCGYDGGFDDELTLYVVNEATIKPVLVETMARWRYGIANRCNGGEGVSRTDANVSISVEPTSSNGLADLKLSARASDGRKAVTTIVKYNGEEYDLRLWKEAFNAWWE